MKRLLLAGAGHAHAQVLKDWITRAVPGTEVILVSPTALAPYSGLVPGWLAGQHRYDEICIDFGALAAAAGVRMVIDTLVSVDPRRRQVRLGSGAEIGYDLLSLNIGSTLSPPPSVGSTWVLSLRPLDALRNAWDELLANPSLTSSDAPLTVTAIGGGAAGVESLLAALTGLPKQMSTRPLQGELFSSGETLLEGLAPGAQRSIRDHMAALGIRLRLGVSNEESALAAGRVPGGDDAAAETTQVDSPSTAGALNSSSDASAFDAVKQVGQPTPVSKIVLWATGAEAHAWQSHSGLAIDERGFIRIDAWLRSVSHPQVYAVGDCAGWAHPLPKSGVFAVRMGPVLSRNLRAALGVGKASRYDPQRQALALIATFDGSAVASWRNFSARGRWVQRWKDWNDDRFLRRFMVRPPTASLTLNPPPLSGDST